MKIINQTNYSTKWLRSLAEFAKPKRIKSVTIIFRASKNGFSGHYKAIHYRSGKDVVGHKKNLIVITIGKDQKNYPRLDKHWKGKGYLDALHLDHEEHIIHILAHEFRHQEQDHRTKIHKVFGSIGKFSERDADAYAIKVQRAWRKTYQRLVPSIAIESLETNDTYYGKWK